MKKVIIAVLLSLLLALFAVQAQALENGFVTESPLSGLLVAKRHEPVYTPTVRVAPVPPRPAPRYMPPPSEIERRRAAEIRERERREHARWERERRERERWEYERRERERWEAERRAREKRERDARKAEIIGEVLGAIIRESQRDSKRDPYYDY